ncbi:flagellar motor protein MotB [Holophaga foetida]|uniref:flagellar motor protein MotB n=1 Tax=Holophaga foetida TaxID=35839 RepID=UPI0002473B34|nr:flagellar motor protein MotB [Holophaga foetida]
MADPQPEVKIKFIKKKGGHAAAHGGAWKIAYADLVTAMMAFFLLMWLLGSANANTKAGIAGMFQDPNFFETAAGKAILDAHGKGILPGGRGMKDGPDGEGGEGAKPAGFDSAEAEQKAMEGTAKAIEAAFSNDKLLQAFKDQISMDFTDEGLRIQVQDKAAQVLFDSGSANVKPYTMTILKEIAAELGKLPNHIAIGGHTDSAQYASKAFTNWELSGERACAARRILESSGLRSGQVRKVTGYADTLPLEGKEPEDGQNRRISIIVLSSATAEAESARQKSKGRFGKKEEKAGE